jgi:hypothetical protein
VLAPDGTMAVPRGPGIGVTPRSDRLAETTLRLETIGPAVGASLRAQRKE